MEFTFTLGKTQGVALVTPGQPFCHTWRENKQELGAWVAATLHAAKAASAPLPALRIPTRRMFAIRLPPRFHLSLSRASALVGGAVVHMSSGWSALVFAIYLGPRKMSLGEMASATAHTKKPASGSGVQA